MTETRVLTAGVLYETDPEFKRMIDTWVQDKCIPPSLHDYLSELGMESQARCAKWCMEQPDRDTFVTRVMRDEWDAAGISPPKTMAVYPSRDDRMGFWYFLITTQRAGKVVSGDQHDCVPRGLIKSHKGSVRGGTICDCILELLDLWV